MLATLSHPLTAAPHGYLPPIPSPLSPRSANIHGRSSRTFFMSSSSDAESEKSFRSTTSAKDGIPFSKRPVKKAPSPKQDELKERRRSMFLKKVRDEREEKRFEARGEDIMRLDFVQRQKQWEAQLAREAPFIDPSDPLEDEETEDVYTQPSSSNVMQISAHSTQQPIFDPEADEVAQFEQEELEYLISSYEPPEAEGLNRPWNPHDLDPNDDTEQHLYSDDDDYDALFAAIVEPGAQQENVPPDTSVQDGGEPMDMS